MSLHLNFLDEQSQLSQPPTIFHQHHRQRRKVRPTAKVKMVQPNAAALRIPECWKTFPKSSPPIFTLPIEIHLRIFELLHPIDAICLSLSCTYIYAISPTNPLSPSSDPNYQGKIHEHSYLSMQPSGIPLNLGSPASECPTVKRSGCKFCVPVLYYPAHCELHYHLRSFMPKDMAYCGGTCQKYTLSAGEMERRRQTKVERRQQKGKERERPREVFSFEYTNEMDIDHEPHHAFNEEPLFVPPDDTVPSDDEESLPSTQNEFTTQRDGVMEYQIEVPGRDTSIIVQEDIVPGQQLLGRGHFEHLLQGAEGSGREMAQQFMARRNALSEHASYSLRAQTSLSLPSTQFPPGSPPMPPCFITAHASGSTNYPHRQQLTPSFRKSELDTICGRCGVSYMHMYSRGRRHLELLRPGEKPGRVRKWYNDSVYNKPGRMRNDDDGSTTGRDDDD